MKALDTIKKFARQAPARKAAPSTSYQSRGLVPNPPKADTEMGSAQPVPIQEIVPELASPFQRAQVYNRMMNDAAVDVSMRAAKTPILGAEFFVEPFSDDPLDIEIAEFVWANLGEGMSSPFLNSLEDILHMYEDGYSIVEKVYEKRGWAPRRTRSGSNTKEYIMLKKLGIRSASTIKEIKYDNNGGPVVVIHNAIQKDKSIKEKTIDISKIIVFTFNRKGGDLQGKSLLRTAYPHWYYKTHMYKIDAIQKERHSLGIPKGQFQRTATNAEKIEARRMLRALRTNEEAFMLLPPGLDVTFEKPQGGELPNALESAVHHNGMILMNVLSQFIALGIDAGGGRATAGTQSDMFMKSLKFVANQIAMQINMYLIPELVVWNFPTNNFPKLQVRNIGETRDLQMLAAALGNLFSQGAITADLDTENYIRQLFDLPRKNPNAIQTTPDKVVEPNANGNGTGKKGNIRPGDIRTGYVGQPDNAPD